MYVLDFSSSSSSHSHYPIFVSHRTNISTVLHALMKAKQGFGLYRRIFSHVPCGIPVKIPTTRQLFVIDRDTHCQLYNFVELSVRVHAIGVFKYRCCVTYILPDRILISNFVRINAGPFYINLNFFVHYFIFNTNICVI